MDASTRSAFQNPGVGGVKVKVRFDSRDLTLTALFAALYVVVNVIQSFTVGNPTVYGPVQLRIADFIIALTILFGWPTIAGVTLGCFLTNAYFYIGVPDVVLGPLANFIAAILVFALRRHRFGACVVGALPIGIIVGGYLWLFFPPPQVGTLPLWAASILSITVSSLVAIAGLGFIVLSLLSRRSIIEPLKSRGLKVLPKQYFA